LPFLLTRPRPCNRNPVLGVMLNLFQHLDPKVRFALKKKPADRCENNVIRDGPPSSGKQQLQADVQRKSVKCRHSDKAPGRNLDALDSRFRSDPEQEHFRTGSLGQASGQTKWGRFSGHAPRISAYADHENPTLCHSDNAPSQNLVLLVRKIVRGQFVGKPRTFRRRAGFNLLFRTPTCNPLPRSSVLTTHNLHLAANLMLFLVFSVS